MDNKEGKQKRHRLTTAEKLALVDPNDTAAIEAIEREHKETIERVKKQLEEDKAKKPAAIINDLQNKLAQTQQALEEMTEKKDAANAANKKLAARVNVLENTLSTRRNAPTQRDNDALKRKLQDIRWKLAHIGIERNKLIERNEKLAAEIAKQKDLIKTLKKRAKVGYNRKFDDKQRAAMIKAKEAGSTYLQIAKMFECSITTIQNVLNEAKHERELAELADNSKSIKLTLDDIVDPADLIDDGNRPVKLISRVVDECLGAGTAAKALKGGTEKEKKDDSE